MSAGFGFSIGDFIAVLKLVSQVVDSLRESSHATSTFRSLITELHSLETALIRIKRLDPDTGQNVDKIALWAAASQCQRTIDDFYGKVKKYQPHLQGGGTGEKIKDVWMKFRWTVCKKDDLDNFRAEIRGHASSIEILLLTVAMDATSTNAKKQDEQNKSLGSRIQDFSMQVFGKLNTITDSIAHNVAQGKALLESSAQIVQTNLRVFQMVHDIQLYILKIPGQVQRQQPVYLIDPLNKECPFHLEFIRSADALLSVLKVNLKESECGPGMIERGEFALEEMGTESTIDLGKSWDNCFYPGQRVAMSMIFPYQTIDSPSCPRCRAEHRGSYDKEVTCTICGIVFRRITEVLEEQQASEATALSMNNGDDMKAPTAPIHGPARPSQKRKREEDDVFTNLRKFRRIRLVPPRPLNEPFVAEMSNHAREGHRCKLYELRQNDWFDLGTGFITTMPHSEGTSLTIRLEDAPYSTILDSLIESHNGYEKQQETLIVFTEEDVYRQRDSIDFGISFQQPQGCSEIWKKIKHTLQEPDEVGSLIEEPEVSSSDNISTPSPISPLPFSHMGGQFIDAHEEPFLTS